jgi:hypothetical protein
VDNRQTAECLNCRQPISRVTADAWLASVANRPARVTDWVDEGGNPYCSGGGWTQHQPDPATVPQP